MKLVLINPPSDKGKYEHEHLAIPKVGVAYMAALLEKHGIPCSIIDAKFEHLTVEQVMDRAVAEKPDIIGISAMTPEIISAAEVARLVKERMPQVTTLIGGAHAIAIPYETMEEFKDFDILVNGEGEFTVLDLIQALEEGKSLEGVKGILYREDGRVLATPARDWITDLDSLPFPAWDKYPWKPPFFYVLSTRGCPHNCAFCMTILGKKQRKRSPENVADEIQWLSEHFGSNEFTFLDETFTLDRQRSDRLLELLIDRGLNKKMRWVAQTRVDRVDEELFVKLKQAGCYKIEFGVESGNQKILKEIKKGITLEQVEKAVRLAKKAGLQSACSFILGHPYETKQTAQDTIDFIARVNPDIVSVGIMVPHPGTRIYDMARNGEGDYILTATDWRDFVKFGGSGLELKNLSRRDLEKLQAKAYLSLYFKNYRFIEFISYAIEHRRQALTATKKLVGDLLSRGRN